MLRASRLTITSLRVKPPLFQGFKDNVQPLLLNTIYCALHYTSYTPLKYSIVIQDNT